MDKEGERRKRKMENNYDEENEEEKMEKFFALIRSTRKVRESIASKVDRVKEEIELKKKANEEEKLKAPATGWFPTFQLEDFMADFRSKAAAHATEPGPSTITFTLTTTSDDGNKEDKGKEGDDNLDLELSL